MSYKYNPLANELDYYEAIGELGALQIANNLSDVADAETSFDNIKQLATEDYAGVLEIATDVEAVAKIESDKILVPSNIDNILAEPGNIGGTTPGEGTFTTLKASDPVDADGVGDRGFNDTRYLGIYDTIYMNAASMTPCTTNPALQGKNEYGTNDIDLDYFAFDAGAVEERVQFKLKMPESWDRSTIKIKIDWSSATGSTSGDTVEWGIKAGALSDNDAIDAALGTPQVISDALLANNGTDLQTTPATPALTVGGTPVLGDLIVFELYRNTDGSDTMTEDAWLFGLTIQYKKTGTVSAW